MEDAKLAILTDAKQEYSHHLASVLKTPIYKGLKSLYHEADRVCLKEKRKNEVLSEFQNLLSQVRLWSQDMINNEFKRISEDSQCDFIKELVTAVFMSHTQILQFVRQGEKAQTKLDIPKPEHFIHKCYINCSREFWKDPMWYYEDSSTMSANELKRNIREAENIIYTCINDTIRELLPFRRILKTYLKDAYNEEELDKNDIDEPMSGGLSKSYQNNLREIIKSEISSYTLDKENSESEIKSLIAKELKLPNEEVVVAETSPKTLTEKVNAQLKDIKETPNKAFNNKSSTIKQAVDEFIEDVPEISLDEMAGLGEDSETEDEVEPRINLEIDLEEVKTPQPSDGIAFNYNEVNLDAENLDEENLDELDFEELEKIKRVGNKSPDEQDEIDFAQESFKNKNLRREPMKEPVYFKEPVKEPMKKPVYFKEPVKEPIKEPVYFKEPVKESANRLQSVVESTNVFDKETKQVEIGNQKKEVEKTEKLIVEKQDNPFNNLTNLPADNKNFDPNFDLDGEINLWEDAPLQKPKEVIEHNQSEYEEEAKPVVSIGPKKFKFFSRN
jgi:hypothetical protein